MKEKKPPKISQQYAVYYFKCNLFDAHYVGYTCRYLHQRTEEHKLKVSAIGNHLGEKHEKEPDSIAMSGNLSFLFISSELQRLPEIFETATILTHGCFYDNTVLAAFPRRKLNSRLIL